MNDTIADLRAEYAGLADLARTLTPDPWRLPSKFCVWTPWDEIAHLCFFDETGHVHRWRADEVMLQILSKFMGTFPKAS